MAEHSVTVESTLQALLADKKYATIRDILITMNPSDIASVFDELEEERLPLLFRLLPKELAAETFVEMDPDAQELLIRGFSDSELREVLDELYAVVDNGGYVIDVIVEHPVYGQLSGELNIHSRFDVDEFVRHVRESGASQLCDLTGGLHIHTLSLPDKNAYDRITRRLREMGILIE